MNMPVLCNTVSPYLEMVAYETLWPFVSSQKQLSEVFASERELPTQILKRQEYIFQSEAWEF